LGHSYRIANPLAAMSMNVAPLARHFPSFGR
jgi:hypothetical protein